MKKGQKIYSILKGKCPRCHEGDFFKHPFPTNPTKITKLHTTCSHCNLKYMMEPSFFYGAMYVNYGLTVAVLVAAFIITKLFIGLTLPQSLIASAIIFILVSPLNLRLSRILWINMFVSFDGNFAKK